MSTNANNFSRMTYIILTLSCSSLVQAGNFAGGTGRADDPYRIATAEQLISAGSTWTGYHFILLNDIDLDPNLPGGRVFDGAVIASGALPYVNPFAGNFNGGRHTIRNLVIRAKVQSNWHPTWAGLFGGIEQGAVVKDLRIEAADVQVIDRHAGILAGESGGRVINCQVSGRVSSNRVLFPMDEVGGLIGRNTGDVINCRADTDWVWGNQCVGGLVGFNDSTGIIAGCRAVGKQVGVYEYGVGGLVGINRGCVIGSEAMGGIFGQDVSHLYGGLAGINSGTTFNCHAGSNIVAGTRCSKLGGLAGENWGTIANCYASGNISTQNQAYIVGGLVGANGNAALGLPGRVVNSYAAGKISTGPEVRYAGGLVGDNAGGEVTMSFWDTETTGLRESAGGTGLLTARMQQSTTFLEAGWDFVDERANGVTDTWRMPEGGGYPVLTLESHGYVLRMLTGAGTPEVPYQIASPEDLGILWRYDPTACYQLVSDLDLSALHWIGAPIAAFNGTFDGGGFVISHLTLHERGPAGLFATLGRDALVMDLGIADANVVGEDDARDLGILAGRKHGGHVNRCYATGRLAAGRRSFGLGGLIGNNGGSVTDCYTSTALSCGIESSHVGGLVGYDKGLIQRSYAAGAVAAVDPNETCGGLLGTTATTITKVMMIACYFLAPPDGGGLNNGLGVPLTDARMKQPTSFLNWDFQNTWAICAGVDYPRLRWEKIDCNQP